MRRRSIIAQKIHNSTFYLALEYNTGENVLLKIRLKVIAIFLKNQKFKDVLKKCGSQSINANLYSK